MTPADIAALRATQAERARRVKANTELNARLKAGELVTLEWGGPILGDPVVDLDLALDEIERLRKALTEIANSCGCGDVEVIAEIAALDGHE